MLVLRRPGTSYGHDEIVGEDHSHWPRPDMATEMKLGADLPLGANLGINSHTINSTAAGHT